MRYIEAEFARRTPDNRQAGSFTDLRGNPGAIIIFVESVVLHPEVGTVCDVPGCGNSVSRNVSAIDIIIDIRKR